VNTGLQDPPEYYNPPGGLLAYEPQLGNLVNESVITKDGMDLEDYTGHFNLVNAQLTQVCCFCCHCHIIYSSSHTIMARHHPCSQGGRTGSETRDIMKDKEVAGLRDFGHFRQVRQVMLVPAPDAQTFTVFAYTCAAIYPLQADKSGSQQVP